MFRGAGASIWQVSRTHESRPQAGEVGSGEVRADIEGGLSISDALKKHPVAFPEIYCAKFVFGQPPHHGFYWDKKRNRKGTNDLFNLNDALSGVALDESNG